MDDTLLPFQVTTPHFMFLAWRERSLKLMMMTTMMMVMVMKSKAWLSVIVIVCVINHGSGKAALLKLFGQIYSTNFNKYIKTHIYVYYLFFAWQKENIKAIQRQWLNVNQETKTVSLGWVSPLSSLGDGGAQVGLPNPILQKIILSTYIISSPVFPFTFNNLQKEFLNLTSQSCFMFSLTRTGRLFPRRF